MRIALVLIFILILSNTARAAGNHIYLGFGQNYASMETIRLGVGDWEFGQLSRNFYGAEKLFPFGNYYTGLGLGLFGATLGFQASAGFNIQLFWSVRLRGELFAVHGLSGVDEGRALLGIEIGF